MPNEPAASIDALVNFAREVVRTAFAGGGLDGADIQELAFKHGLVVKTPYDPDKHQIDADFIEPGDEIYVFLPFMTVATGGTTYMGRHVMIDLETLGTRPNALILSVGCAVFNPDAQAPLGELFELYPSLDEQLDNGARMDAGAFAWWLRQSEEARTRIATGASVGRCKVGEVVTKLHELAAGPPVDAWWAWGSNFDYPILESMIYGAGSTAMPWVYNKIRDARGLCTLFNFAVDRTSGTAHTALDDARAQALTVCSMLRQLKERGVVARFL